MTFIQLVFHHFYLRERFNSTKALINSLAYTVLHLIIDSITGDNNKYLRDAPRAYRKFIYKLFYIKWKSHKKERIYIYILKFVL